MLLVTVELHRAIHTCNPRHGLQISSSSWIDNYMKHHDQEPMTHVYVHVPGLINVCCKYNLPIALRTRIWNTWSDCRIHHYYTSLLPHPIFQQLPVHSYIVNSEHLKHEQRPGVMLVSICAHPSRQQHTIAGTLITPNSIKLLEQFYGCACKISYGNGYTNIPVHHMDDLIYCFIV